MDIDKLLLYRGEDFQISKYIKIKQPTLDEICKYGERQYYQMIHEITSVGADYKWQLDDLGIDYTQIDDFTLFHSLLIKGYTKKETSIIFGDLDFTKFQLRTNKQNGELCMVQKIGKELNDEIIYLDEDTIIIDAYTYKLIVDYLREMHGLKRNSQLPANESTKRILIDDARDEYLMNKNKEYKSRLFNLISSMVNSEGFKFDCNNIWKMKIYPFMDSVNRIAKIKNATLMLQSGYSGYGIDLKKIDNKQIDWQGELE